MLVFAVALQAEARQWIQGNWVSIVVMLAMVGLIVVLVLLALARDQPTGKSENSGNAQEPQRQNRKSGSSPPE